MHEPATPGLTRPGGATSLPDLERAIEHAAHLLPTQGPITVFVHHNTLHAFEELPFEEALKRGAATYDCQPYWPEDTYRREVSRGRILPEDLAATLLEDMGEDADFTIDRMGTCLQLRLAMLEHPLRLGSDEELRWLIAETDALNRFRDEAPREASQRVIDQVRQWILRDYLAADPGPAKGPADALLARFGASDIERWSDARWESFTLHLLWRICRNGVHGVERFDATAPPLLRHRDLLLKATARDIDQLVNEVLIRFCAAFLDQGFAGWPLPGRDEGFFRSFALLYRDARPVEPWLRGLPAELERIGRAGLSPLESIDESLRLLGVSAEETETYVGQTLLALSGWAGMLRQMETNAEWTVRPAPSGTLVEYLAIRLILERLALTSVAAETLPGPIAPDDLGPALRRLIPQEPRVRVDLRAYLVFQLAQVRGWSPVDLDRLPKAGWSQLVEEIERFDTFERRRIYLLAYERHFRTRTLDSVQAHCERAGDADAPPAERGPEARPSFQLVCCLDEREESFRRHLEEIEPACETFGMAGFFGTAMYYRGVAEAHYRPLCPINIKPSHYVQEEPLQSFRGSGRHQAAARRNLGRISLGVHVGTRTFVGGLLTGLLGSLATFPLLARVLMPRRTARIRRALGRMVTPAATELHLERSGGEPGPGDGQLGYSGDEMAGIVAGGLRAIGMDGRYARLVVLAGHGSSSLNNPQAAAYDCGACGGARGGPNARAFAQMANDPRVRRVLAGSGIMIPEDVVFVGAFHNTCDDSITFFDLDRLPTSHHEAFNSAKGALDVARRRNAQERCRRFESAGLSISADEALRHVESRAEDLSQTRPEYGHSTNAACIVGRRSRTRGLFLDRRSFLTSYDPTRDDPDSSILRGLLRAVIPVCGGISLEYFFSTVDNTGYGCGTKLPHNIASLLGVMDGAASDLRPGLSWQMVEIHEPMRILFVVETTPEAMSTILAEEAFGPLVGKGWVQLATLDPHSAAIHVYRDGRFEPYAPRSADLPVVPSSQAWYRGWRDHLGYASIVPDAGPAIAASQGAVHV